MLTNLMIENVAVIEKADVSFQQGLNVLTGETGAGKSILIDSITAILGGRTSKELVRTGAAKASIRAVFDEVPMAVQKRLEQAGYETSSDLMLYREIAADGKNSCRINGMPATVTALREICGGLIQISGQHDSSSLLNEGAHLSILDTYAQNQALHADYYAVYRQLVAIKRELDALNMDEAEKQRRIELLRFQTEEIDSADLHPQEDVELEAQRKVLSAAQTIQEKLYLARAVLYGGDETSGATDLLQQAMTAVSAAAAYDPQLQEPAGRLTDLYYAARDTADTLETLAEQYASNEQELNRIEARLDEFYKLKQKYGATIDAVIAYGEKAKEELSAIESSQERREALQKERAALLQVARQKAELLTQNRLAAFSDLNAEIQASLAFLNMPNVRLELKHTRGPLASRGQDTVSFYISTNLGETARPLAKIASGGELSRIMLALKAAMADKDSVSTVIYDEIDAGVSGSAAGRIGELMKRSAKGRQVLCITHTAQIAACADQHLLIRKQISGSRTYTDVIPLQQQERIQALAQLISGEHITSTSLANAREMLALQQHLNA